MPAGRGGLRLGNSPGFDTVGPVGERSEMAALRGHQLGDKPDHIVAGGADRETRGPGVVRSILNRPKVLRNGACGVIAHLMAVAAAIGLDEIEPLLLCLEVLGDAVALVAGAGKEALVRDLQHRIPVIGRDSTAPRRRGLAPTSAFRSRSLPGSAIYLGRVDEAVAAHPDLVFGLRQIRDHVAAALVGDSDLGEAGAEIAGLGDDPDAGLRAEAARNDSADVVAVYLDRGWGRTAVRREAAAREVRRIPRPSRRLSQSRMRRWSPSSLHAWPPPTTFSFLVRKDNQGTAC